MPTIKTSRHGHESCLSSSSLNWPPFAFVSCRAAGLPPGFLGGVVPCSAKILS